MSVSSFRLVAAAIASLLGIGTAQATVHVSIDLSRQRMQVVSSRGAFEWPISSARSGFSTPGGSYAPVRLERMHYSRKYDMSPMPHAIFFHGGYAIHGSYATGSLGRPASHGCVRLAPGNAAALYSMVRAEGARISIHGRPPASRPVPRTTYAAREYGSGGFADAPYREVSRRSYRRRGDDEGGYREASPYAPYPAYEAMPPPYYPY